MTEQTRESLVDLPVADFLNQLASRAPTPGGGAVAGLAGALSVALGRMVGAYSVGKMSNDEDRAVLDDIQRRLARADERMRHLIDEDARAYAAYAALPREQREATDDERRLADLERRAALDLAINVPMSICATAADALAIFEELAPKASRWILSDLEAAAILAEATIRCAGCSVRVNAANLDDPARAAEVATTFTGIEQRGKELLAAVLAAVAGRVESQS
jgi:formiminotetrahydrofolate cyclodeaminase